MIDRSDTLRRVANGEPISLELGCGRRKRHAAAIGVDQVAYPGVDLQGDVFDVLASLPDKSVTAVYAYHFLEHVDDLPRVMREIARVLQPGSEFDVEVPHFANPYFYSDPTHRRFFGLYTFCYWSEGRLFRRTVPQYEAEPLFRLIDVELQFDSPFPIRGIVRRFVGPLFNLTRWLQEYYEENLCYLFPCYQLHYSLRRL